MSEKIQVTADAAGFAPVPLRLLKDEAITDPTTIAVYVALASFVSFQTAECYPSLASIGKLARCSDDTALAHIRGIPQYVEIKSGKAQGRPNNYHLIDPWGKGTAPAREGSRTGSGGGTEPARDERDPLNEKKKPRHEDEPERPKTPHVEPDFTDMIWRAKSEEFAPIVAYWGERYPELNIDEQLRQALDYAFAHPEKHYRKWFAYLNNWMRNAHRYASKRPA